MLFNSFPFLIFYVVVVSVFFAMPHRYRWIFLLAASYYFYMCWKAEYIVLVIAVTLINYLAGLGLGRWENLAVRRLLLIVSVVASLGILFTYKYLDFFGQSVRVALESVNVFVNVPLFQLILPLGISFFTFQSLGYTIDVYRRSVAAENHLGIFALYVSFFPQLVAGPIERGRNLLPQFRQRKELNLPRAVEGFRLMLWGLFKKIVIADNLANVVDTVYAAPESYSGPILVLATLSFAIQIYCDFAGYSDIAIGAARVMGYDLMTNFRQPYFATSVADFWRRWHISLSTWFRDYVYVPLGGNRVGRARWRFNIAAVFLLSGVWHGANWTFVAWGALHGAYMICEQLTAAARRWLEQTIGLARRPKLHSASATAITFILVLVAWVLFRARTIDQALFIVSRMASFEDFHFSTIWTLGLPRFELTVAWMSVMILFVIDWSLEFSPGWVKNLWRQRGFRWVCYLAGFYWIVFFGVFGKVEFIYFQF